MSWPPQVVVSGFILYSSFLFDPVPSLVWLSWIDRRYLPRRSHPMCIVWSGLVVCFFKSDTQIRCFVKSFTKLKSKYLVSRNLGKRKNFTISQV